MPTFTVAAWLERYEVILDRRELKPNTMKVRRNQNVTLKEEFGKIPRFRHDKGHSLIS
ncbi:hypothetical protein ACP3P6_15045 [Enterobacter mori]